MNVDSYFYNYDQSLTSDNASHVLSIQMCASNHFVIFGWSISIEFFKANFPDFSYSHILLCPISRWSFSINSWYFLTFFLITAFLHFSMYIQTTSLFWCESSIWIYLFDGMSPRKLCYRGFGFWIYQNDQPSIEHQIYFYCNGLWHKLYISTYFNYIYLKFNVEVCFHMNCCISLP